MGRRGWLEPSCTAVCFTLNAGEKKMNSCWKIKPNTSSKQKSKWHLKNIYTCWRSYQDMLSVGEGNQEATSFILKHSTWGKKWMFLLLGKHAMHLFFSLLRIWKQNLLSQCFDRHDQFNPRVWQHNVGLMAGRTEVRPKKKKYHMYFPKAAQLSPNGSTWFNAISFHNL